jgi:alpha-D-xyloside xylohydrolase
LALACTATRTTAALTAVQKSPDGITVSLPDGGTVQLQVWADRTIRVRSAAGPLAPSTSLAVVGQPNPATHWDVIDTADHVGVRTAAVEARVDRATGTASFADAITGKPFLSEAADGRGTTTTTIAGHAVHGPAQSFTLAPVEAIYGLGQHQVGVMDYVGTTVHLQQKNADVGVPVLTSSAGYTLLWDNPSVTDVDVGKAQPGIVRWSSEAGVSTDYYVCYGPELDTAIQGYRTLTGAAPMFGRWAWGFWQSRERYESQAQILGVAAEYRARHIPLDGVVQDWQYWGKAPWGSHTFGSQFPDPAGLVRTLHDEHVHAIISVWAKFDQGSANYDELKRAGFLFPTVYRSVYPPGWNQWYDAFNPGARAMYWRQINDDLGKLGWDGWWLDATEPELGGTWGEMRDLATAAGPGYAVFNAYPLETTSAVYQGNRARTSAERSFILTRSAYAGQQRNGAVTWSGDIQGTWPVLKRQIPAGLNFVASGIPYWNTDIGGFFGGDHDDPAYRELFTRWFQFGSFCPMFRVHGTGSHKEQWEFGPDVQRVLLKYDQLRYRLLPYTYALSWNVTHDGGTMIRPLAFDFRTDPAVHAVADQFMFGSALMPCPVTEAIGGTPAVVPPAALVDRDGVPGGLSASYFQGMAFEKPIAQRKDAAIDFDWDHVKREGVGANPRTDPIPGLTMDRFSARWEGSVQTDRAGTYRFHLTADDGMRMWIDGKLVVDDWHARKAVTRHAAVDLPAHSRVPIRIEYFQNLNAALIELRWQPPTGDAGPFTRRVYLPAGTWRDFWTGATLVGGRTVDAPAPIETMPLFVRDGSIVPMGPVVEYADQRPDAPLELRVYRGRNGSFTLYDDAGDGYGYERGEHATIPLTWDDAAATLTIGPRAGGYPGMPAKRQFKVVWVSASHGAGLEETAEPDRVVDFDGTPVTVRAAANP